MFVRVQKWGIWSGLKQIEQRPQKSHRIHRKLKKFGVASHIEFDTIRNRETKITEFEFLLEFKVKPMGDVHIVPPI